MLQWQQEENDEEGGAGWSQRRLTQARRSRTVNERATLEPLACRKCQNSSIHFARLAASEIPAATTHLSRKWVVDFQRTDDYQMEQRSSPAQRSTIRYYPRPSQRKWTAVLLHRHAYEHALCLATPPPVQACMIFTRKSADAIKATPAGCLLLLCTVSFLAKHKETCENV